MRSDVKLRTRKKSATLVIYGAGRELNVRVRERAGSSKPRVR